MEDKERSEIERGQTEVAGPPDQSGTASQVEAPLPAGDVGAADPTIPAQPAGGRDRAAIVIGPILVQSMATPVVGLAMLVVGLLVGYFGRPLVAAPPPSPTPLPTAARGGEASDDRAALMEMVVSETRHFKGADSAPVTIIEFSDFQ